MKKALIFLSMVLIATVAAAEGVPAVAQADTPQIQLAVEKSDPVIDALVDSWQPRLGMKAKNGLQDLAGSGIRLVNLKEEQSSIGASAGPCPAVTQCAGPNCNPGPCAISDTMMQGCTQGGIGLLCLPGKTIHVQTCNCSCSGPFCSVQCPSSQQQKFGCR